MARRLPLDGASRALMLRLWREHVRAHLPRLVVAMLLMALAAAATAALAKLIEPVLDKIFTAKDSALLWPVVGGVLASFLVKAGSMYGEAVLINATGQRIVAELQRRMFAHLMTADLAFFHDQQTGGLVSRFTNDVNLLRGVVSNSLTALGRDALSVVFLVAVMIHQDWTLAAIAFLAFPTAILPTSHLARRMRKVSRSAQEETGRFASLLDQAFSGMRHVKAYGMEGHETARAGALIGRMLGLAERGGRVRAASNPMMEALGGFAIVAVIAYGGSEVIAGDRTTGSFFSFITALLLAYEPVKRISNLAVGMQEGMAAAQRVFSLIDSAPAIADRPDAAALVVDRGAVRFEAVRFCYRGDGPAILDGFDLTVPAGARVALVGPSGAGKSTILNLIPRFFDATGGRVLIDGQDVRDVTMASLRARIALVSQEISLFDGTIRDNIRYGRWEASEAEIVAAAQAAAAHDFILAQPGGYDAEVGELGVKLSGGQRQRIAIARAMLKDAPILLLDEATSALDAESERQVQAALARLSGGRTSLIVAHRLATVVDCDLIVVVENGRVAEQGSHADLLARDGAYAKLWRMQTQAQTQSDAAPLAVG